MMDRCTGVQGLAVERRRVASGESVPAVRAPQSPGYRGRPPRPYLMRAKRDNPVGVRCPATGAGKPTVREAQLPSGQRMVGISVYSPDSIIETPQLLSGAAKKAARGVLRAQKNAAYDELAPRFHEASVVRAAVVKAT